MIESDENYIVMSEVDKFYFQYPKKIVDIQPESTKIAFINSSAKQIWFQKENNHE